MSNKIDFSKLTLQDALDIAILIEEEARERYDDFAEQIGTRYEHDAGDFFKKMSENEAKHGHEISKRRKDLFKNAPSNVNESMIWDVEAPGYDEPRAFMSVKQAFKIAIHAEKKAYDFYNNALKHIDNQEVKALFTELRDEELEHEKMLQDQLSKLKHLSDDPDIDDDGADEPPAL